MPSFAEFSFPIGVVLLPFGLFMLFYCVYSLFNLYHLLRFGVAGAVLYGVTALYAAGTVAILVAVIWGLSPYDFSYPVSLSGVTAALMAPPSVSL